MRRHSSATDGAAGTALAALTTRYGADRHRVESAHRLMRAVVATCHDPAEARVAAAQLTAALRQATVTVTRVLQYAEPEAPARYRPCRHRRRATLAVPEAVRPWSAELVRLAEIGVWLRRTTADDLGVRVPTAVRVGSRAASGPHVAGLVAEPDDLVAATLPEPRIGVDLRAAVDHGDGRDAEVEGLSTVSSPAHTLAA